MSETIDFIIRDAVERDIPGITDIYAHHVLHGLASFEEVPPTEQEMTERLKALREKDYPYFVAINSNEEIVGYAYAGAYRARPAYRNSVENSVYVAFDKSGLGIGSDLLQATIDACISRQFRLMIAVIGDSDNNASIALHKRHGFTLVGVLKDVGFKHNRWVDSVYMQRMLTI